MAESAEHFLACEKLRKELPHQFDSNFHAELDTEEGREKLDQFKYHLNKIKEYNEKIRLLKKEATTTIDKSEKNIIKRISQGYGIMNKKIDDIDKILSDNQTQPSKIQEITIKSKNLNSK